MPAWCCRSRPAFRPAPRSSWLRRCSISCPCCSAASVGWCGNSSPAGISRPDAMRRALFSIWLALLGSPAGAEERLNVVASFSILADFVRNVGGDRVKVTSLVGPNSDVHVYTPAPGDAKTAANAKLVVINGLGLEGWLPRLAQSSGSKAQVVVATKGIPPLKLGSEADPHAWQSAHNPKL